MRCPFCSDPESRVVDSRESADSIRRRRECLKCKKRFTTYERIQMRPLAVIKKDGGRESFDREKLLRGIRRACEKRPVSTDQMEQLLNEIESALREKGVSEIPSSTIGSLMMRKLKKLDKVAYIRFASVYREFADISDFQEEVKKLVRKK